MARLSLSSIALPVKRLAPKVVFGCVSLVAFSMIASCLVTSTPDFRAPAQTKPFLETSGALPDPRYLFVVSGTTGTTATGRIDFEARLESEDEGEDVSIFLYTDYGAPDPYGDPFALAVGQPPVKASTLSDPKPRLAKARFNFAPGSIVGCHSFTMMASHKFDFRGCPTDLADSSSLTWLVYFCDPMDPNCVPTLDKMDESCQPPPKGAMACPSGPDASTSASTGSAQ